MSDTQNVEPASTGWGIVRRLVQAFGFVGIAIIVGTVLGTAIAKHVHSPADQAYLAGALGLSAVLASLDKFIKQAPLLIRWIQTGSGNGLSAFASFMFLSVITLSAALLSGAMENTKPPPPFEPPIATSNSVLFVNVPAPKQEPDLGRESIFLIPFFNEAGGCSTSDDRFKRGSALDDATRTFITRLAQGFLRCAQEDRPVKLEVRGFASSKQFDDKCGPNGQPLSVSESRRLNKEIANARAQAVVNEFTAAETAARAANPNLSGRVFAEPIVWRSFDAMKADRRWNDKDGGQYSHDRAILTRRAEVEVVDSADCDVVTPPRLDHAATATKSSRRGDSRS